MNIQNQFNKTISENIHKLKQEECKDFQGLLYKFQDIQRLEFLFSNSRTFKDFQVLYEPCHSGIKTDNCDLYLVSMLGRSFSFVFGGIL
jgi:hypothetical protein